MTDQSGTPSTVTYPWWEGSRNNGSYGRFADDSSNAVRINSNGQMAENQADCTRSVLGLGLDNINSSFNSATRSREFAAVCKSQTDAEFRMLDRFRDQDREVNANAREAAECCCSIKLQMCEDKAELKSEILAVETRNVRDQLEVCRASKLDQKLDILLARTNG